jgi:RND family efflux transporter MFP subunit
MKRIVLLFGIVIGFSLTASPVVYATAEDFEGLIYPSEVVKVGSQVSGILEEIPVERGDIVKKGQVLARLKSGQEKASLELSRANLEFLKRKMERNAELAKKHLISANENDELVTEFKKAGLQLEEAQEKLKLRTIQSTIDGVVTDRLMAPGDYVGETPVLKLASLNPLKVEVIVPTKRFGAVIRGMRAEVRPEFPVGGVYVGKVTIVDKVVDPASSTFIVRVDIANPELKVPSGLKCRVRFIK